MSVGLNGTMKIITWLLYLILYLKWWNRNQLKGTEIHGKHSLEGEAENNLQLCLSPIKPLLFLFVISLHFPLPCTLRYFISIHMPHRINKPFWFHSNFSHLLPFFIWTTQVCYLNLTFYLLFPCQFFRYLLIISILRVLVTHSTTFFFCHASGFPWLTSRETNFICDIMIIAAWRVFAYDMIKHRTSC